MFTGIIEATAEILQKSDTQLVIQRPAHFDPLLIGASISVSGVCLSIVAFDDTSMTFDVVSETWQRSILGSLSEGQTVNLERSVLADQRLDGHTVQGHIEGKGTVCSRTENGELSLEVPDDLIKFCVQKGSIAINGVSLTIASVSGNTITVALVPHTLEQTNLRSLTKGDLVNIETDIVGRYLYAFLHEEVTHQH